MTIQLIKGNTYLCADKVHQFTVLDDVTSESRFIKVAMRVGTTSRETIHVYPVNGKVNLDHTPHPKDVAHDLGITPTAPVSTTSVKNISNDDLGSMWALGE